MGVEVDSPLCTRKSFEKNFMNDARSAGTSAPHEHLRDEAARAEPQGVPHHRPTPPRRFVCEIALFQSAAKDATAAGGANVDRQEVLSSKLACGRLP
jgi:hypothetical protein